MSEWQPIESAPKDGKSFLCSDGKNVLMGKYSVSTNRTHYGKLKVWGVSFFASGTHNFNIKAWMPLPNPPEVV
jgi:ABC-type phosphonate transport system ATPase subunit